MTKKKNRTYAHIQCLPLSIAFALLGVIDTSHAIAIDTLPEAWDRFSIPFRNSSERVLLPVFSRNTNHASQGDNHRVSRCPRCPMPAHSSNTNSRAANEAPYLNGLLLPSHVFTGVERGASPAYVNDAVRQNMNQRIIVQTHRQGFVSPVFLYDAGGSIIGVESTASNTRRRMPDTQQSSTTTTDEGERWRGRINDNRREDVDVCCRTREIFFLNTTLVDIYGTVRTVAQSAYLGTPQYIRHGLCSGKGSCMGRCSEEWVSQSLIILPIVAEQGINYMFFNIPSYCSCKVTRQW